MKMCIVAPADNYHTHKWCKWFLEHGHTVHVVSFTNGDIPGAVVHHIDSGVNVAGGDWQKLKYLLYARKLKKIVKNIKPNIISVHYASSYGAVVALSGLKGYALSVWGSDIYDFPQKSILHKWLLKYSLRKAGYLLSTSYAMAKETCRYTNKDIIVTPFGVDMNLFNPNKRNREDKEKDFIVGTIKSLDPKYGIEYLLKAVKIVDNQDGEKHIKIRIAGKGPYENEYKNLASKLNLDVSWLGFISQKRVAEEWANMDIAIIPSTLDSESFGVSAVEAEASGVPVIISDVPGLMEATSPGVTSLVVKRCDEYDLANAIVELKKNPERRKRMGEEGREYVFSHFELDHCFEKIEKQFLIICENNLRKKHLKTR